MSITLKNYTLKFLATALLIVIAVWTSLFYALMLEELYDNTDDGLKDQKIQIIRKAYENESILKQHQFDLNQYKITPISAKDYLETDSFRNENFFMEYDEEMEPYRVLETYFIDKNGNHHKLEIRTATVEEDDFIESLLIALVILYILIIASILIINNISLKKIWKPFYSTLNYLRDYEFGKNKKLISNKTPITEFKLLDSEIAKMITRNEKSVYQQKQFIENASHELQTPIAVALNQIDVLLESDDLTQKNYLEINQIRNTLKRMSTLNQSLLMLSKIENQQFKDKEEVVFNTVVKTMISDFNSILEFKSIALELIENGEFKTLINKDFAYSLLSNLIKNSIKYNINNGKIIIEIDNLSLKIKNTSKRKTPLNSEDIFKRFYKESEDHLSTGLGLSIVKTIIDNHSNMDISYAFEDPFHVFSLKIKNS